MPHPNMTPVPRPTSSKLIFSMNNVSSLISELIEAARKDELTYERTASGGARAPAFTAHSPVMGRIIDVAYLDDKLSNKRQIAAGVLSCVTFREIVYPAPTTKIHAIRWETICGEVDPDSFMITNTGIEENLTELHEVLVTRGTCVIPNRAVHRAD